MTPTNRKYIVETSDRRSKPVTKASIREMFDAGKIPKNATVRQFGTKLKRSILEFLETDKEVTKIPPRTELAPPLPSPRTEPPSRIKPAKSHRHGPSVAVPRTCPFCAEVIQPAAKKCRHCGEILDPTLRPFRTERSPNKVIAFLFAFFLGWFGFHKFYLGQTGAGATYLILNVLFCWTIIVPVVFALVCLVESITYLTYSDEAFAETYGR
jgi:TM2 domain-containing membrane protein YozV